MKISGIYKIQSKKKPNRYYIGSSIDISKRWRVHLSCLKKNKHPNKKLQNHYNKYTGSDLQFSVLTSCEKKELIKHEQFFIDSYNPYFNIVPKAGSSLGHKMSEETKRKLSEINTGRIGTSCSEETKEKLRKINTGRKHSLDTKEKLKIIANKRAADIEWVEKVSKTWFTQGKRDLTEEQRDGYRRRASVIFKGKKHSIETKKLMSDKAKQRERDWVQIKTWNKIGSKAVMIPVIANKNGVKTVYESIADLEKGMGMNGTNGSLRRKLTSKGSHYLKKYKTEVSYA